MKKISDFNSATEKYPVVYAGSATRPDYVAMPTLLQQQEGVAPLDTCPAQWWNAMWKLATQDINAFRDFVGDAFTEINNLLTKFGITLDDADSEQLYDFFHDEYVQNYLSTALSSVFVNKSGDTIDGDLHIKGDLSVDGIGEEVISTELKVGANTITLRNGNPSSLGNTELAGVVTNNYDGNNNNNIIAIDKNGVARTGDIDIATRILYSSDGTNFFTDEELTEPATIGATEQVRDTGNQTSGGVEIYEGITYSNDDSQALATRDDNLTDGQLVKWDGTTKKLVSTNSYGGTAAKATILETARKINGTLFNGSTDITTAKWGTSRNITIKDSDGTNTGNAVAVDGSTNASLRLPSTIKASITGDCSGSAGQLSSKNWGQTACYGVYVDTITESLSATSYTFTITNPSGIGTLAKGSTVKVMFRYPLQSNVKITTVNFTFGGRTGVIKAQRNNGLSNVEAHLFTGGSITESHPYKVWDAYTTLELLWDGNNWVVMGNPVLCSYFSTSQSYAVFANGLIEQWGRKTDSSESGTITLLVIYTSSTYVINTLIYGTDTGAVTTVVRPVTINQSNWVYKSYFTGKASSGGADDSFHWLCKGY